MSKVGPQHSEAARTQSKVHQHHQTVSCCIAKERQRNEEQRFKRRMIERKGSAISGTHQLVREHPAAALIVHFDSVASPRHVARRIKDSEVESVRRNIPYRAAKNKHLNPQQEEKQKLNEVDISLFSNHLSSNALARRR